MRAKVVEILSKEKLRAVVIGLGKMGILHASILRVLPSVQLVALCDKSRLMLRLSRKIFINVDVVDDVKKLAGLDIDAAYVTTPIFSHAAVAKIMYSDEIARNLFVEKTLAASYDEAEELCRLARKFSGTNMVGYMKRFAVTFMKAKDLLAQKVLGEIASFEAYAYSSDFLDGTGNSKMLSSRGGPLRDLGCHVVDLALWFFGDLRVDSIETHSPTRKASDNSIYFRVKNAHGLNGCFSVSQSMVNYRMPEIGMLITGSKGTISVADDNLRLKLHDGKSYTWYTHDLNDGVEYWLGGSEYLREDDYFVKSVLEGRAAEPSFSTASRVDYLIDQVESEGSKNE